jgi:hypothetical protein
LQDEGVCSSSALESKGYANHCGARMCHVELAANADVRFDRILDGGKSRFDVAQNLRVGDQIPIRLSRIPFPAP